MSTALIAIGMAMLCRIFPPTKDPTIDAFLLWFGSGISIGAGLGAPIQKEWWGVAIGLYVQFMSLDLLQAPR